jgi:hypothetical protein
LRVVLSLAAAGLVFLTLANAALAEMAPGHPLYGVKLAVESLTLPGAGSPDRVTAQLRLLHERLDEADAAATMSDGGALRASLNAYRLMLPDLIASTERLPATRLQTLHDLWHARERLRIIASRIVPHSAPDLDAAVEETRAANRSLDRPALHDRPAGSIPSRPEPSAATCHRFGKSPPEGGPGRRAGEQAPRAIRSGMVGTPNRP